MELKHVWDLHRKREVISKYKTFISVSHVFVIHVGLVYQHLFRHRNRVTRVRYEKVLIVEAYNLFGSR